MKENNIEELKQMLEELYRTQQARLDVGADDLDIREEIAEVEEEIKKLQDETMEENSIKNERSSIEEDIKILETWLEELNELFNKTHINNTKERNALYNILSDYKRVLKINEVLLKENEEIRIKNNAIKRESEAYAEHMSRLDNELNLEKEKSKYEWIRQNCLPQELVNKLYIPIQKVKDKIEEIKMTSSQINGDYFMNNYKIEVLQKLLEK